MNDGLQDAAGGTVVYSPEGHRRSVPQESIETYNFRSPGYLSQKDTTQFGAQHQRYIQNLTARLATFLRMEVSCEKKSVRCSSQTFKAFCDGVQPPTHLTLFKVGALEGAGVLELRPQTAVALANRLLGGVGLPSDAERNPTEIEIALLDEIVMMILKDWCHIFEENVGEPVIVGHESGCRFLQIASDESPFFVLSAELKFGELSEAMQLAVPFSMVEVLTKRLAKSPKPAQEENRKPLHWRSPYAAIEVPVTAEWKVREISLGEACGLKAGDLIYLPQELIDQTRVRISETDEFLGTIGVEDGRLAVHLNDRISKD